MRALLQKCEQKLWVEASKSDMDLRLLVGHANMIDSLRDECEERAAWERIHKNIKTPCKEVSKRCSNDATRILSCSLFQIG